MQDVTLKAQDFSTVHNALCSLRSIECNLRDVIGGDSELAKAIESFEAGLRNAYDESTDQTSSKMEYWNEIQSRHGFVGIWSNFKIPARSFIRRQHTDITNVVYKDINGEQFAVSIEGDSILDLYRAANEAIVKSGDMHHVFIESFKPGEYKGQQALFMTCGS